MADVHAGDAPQPPTRQSTRNTTQPTPKPDPWLPIVLSLDGGGVRGLSSLYFIQRLMQEIQVIENKGNERTSNAGTHRGNDLPQPNATGDQALPLPGNYFDFIIGTSTGGLIATMLGLLRMDVNECIKQYFIISNNVFRPHNPLPFIRNYSAKKLEDAICNVMKEHSIGSEYFRQYDHMEKDRSYRDQDPRINKTCKVAITSVRRGGAIGDETAADVPYLFRTYDHKTRYVTYPGGAAAPDWLEYNPKVLEKSQLRIHEACRATSAAPGFFPVKYIKGRAFMDGGVMANNPSSKAYDEASLMAREPDAAHAAFPNPLALVSIGAGGVKDNMSFTLGGLVRTIRNKLTDTEKDHENTRRLCQRSNTHYYRFNVREDKHSEVRGLQTGLDECKRKRIQSRRPWVERKERPIGPIEESADEGPKRGGYRPTKYEYTTFNKLRDRTQDYFKTRYDLSSELPTTVEGMIRECAKMLVEYSEDRKIQDRPRWDSFREHPFRDRNV
ncbi:FabD/lysophospholipase-like protein [Hypomontagnella monticulosa]|nr:FabD/lysophospholipase-like protein [Hypomontagnella monticulosa]